jgi:hypothetical protein
MAKFERFVADVVLPVVGGAWTGDIGQACGADWYYGNQEAGTLPDDSPWRPYCA